jgi:hypothetical protein
MTTNFGFSPGIIDYWMLLAAGAMARSQSCWRSASFSSATPSRVVAAVHLPAASWRVNGLESNGIGLLPVDGHKQMESLGIIPICRTGPVPATLAMWRRATEGMVPIRGKFLDSGGLASETPIALTLRLPLVERSDRSTLISR